MLAVNSKYKSLQLINVNKEVEEIWVKVIITGKGDLILRCVYLPPKSDLCLKSRFKISIDAL
jgi:hypothetical protein